MLLWPSMEKCTKRSYMDKYTALALCTYCFILCEIVHKVDSSWANICIWIQALFSKDSWNIALFPRARFFFYTVSRYNEHFKFIHIAVYGTVSLPFFCSNTTQSAIPSCFAVELIKTRLSSTIKKTSGAILVICQSDLMVE